MPDALEDGGIPHPGGVLGRGAHAAVAVVDVDLRVGRGRDRVEDRDAHPGDQLARGRDIFFDLMVQCAVLDGKKINVQAADIGPRIVGVKRPEDDVIAVHTPDFPSWKGYEGRVRDAVEEGVVREGRRQHGRVTYS